MGIFFKTAGSFKEHIIEVVQKTEDKIAKLTRLIPNIGRPTSSKRAVLVVAVHFLLLYGVALWASALKVKRNWLLLQRGSVR